MKVVCRVIHHHSLTYLKEYDVIDKEERTEMYRGTLYAFEQTPHIKIKNDRSISLWYQRKYFYSKQEERTLKLKKLNSI